MKMARTEDYINYWKLRGINLADLVPVVRCKDCKFMDDAECCTRYADEGAIHSTQLYGHCWLGERRKDECTD